MEDKVYEIIFPILLKATEEMTTRDLIGGITEPRLLEYAKKMLQPVPTDEHALTDEQFGEYLKKWRDAGLISSHNGVQGVMWHAHYGKAYLAKHLKNLLESAVVVPTEPIDKSVNSAAE